MGWPCVQVQREMGSLLTAPGLQPSQAVEALYEALAPRLFDAATMQAGP